MVPSSFITSQITPDGFSPANRLTSTTASVCPARTSTPPSRALKGKMCPGDAISAAPLLGSVATVTVSARSAAEMPVEIPSRASIDSVNADECRAEFLRLIRSSPNWSTRSPVSARQISPRPCIAMKFTACGVHICAGMHRSPSFSRSSWSTRMYIRPLRASSMISSTEEMASDQSVRVSVMGQPLGSFPVL